MRAVIQRVKKASVQIGGKLSGQINAGLLVLFAVHQDDKEETAAKLAEKIINLRIFSDQEGKMNLSLKDINGEILVVSQFTLYGDSKKGNRPSFIKSAKPEKAKPMYEKFINYFKQQGIRTATGEFGAFMEIGLINDGPVTIILEL